MNSFSAMQRAIEFEIERQVPLSAHFQLLATLIGSTTCMALFSASRFSHVIHLKNLEDLQVDLHKSGRRSEILQETRLFDESKSQTFTMRVKEGKFLACPAATLPATYSIPDMTCALLGWRMSPLEFP